MNKTLLILALLLTTLTLSFGQSTSLSGKVTDKDTGEPILFGNVVLYQNDKLVTGVETDFDGNFNFSNIEPGTYDVAVFYVGYQNTKISSVIIYTGKTNVFYDFL